MRLICMKVKGWIHVTNKTLKKGCWRVTWHGNLLLVGDLPKQNSVLRHCIKWNMSNKNVNLCLWLAVKHSQHSYSPVHALVLSFFATKWNENLIAERLLGAAFVLFTAIFTLWSSGCTPAHCRSSGLNVWHLHNSFYGSIPLNTSRNI